MLSLKLAARVSQFARRTQNKSGPYGQCSGGRRGIKVAVVGAAGGIGQPLSMLLKQNSQIRSLALQDIVNVKGVAADISHICTSTVVRAYEGSQELEKALESAAIVVVPAGLPRKPGMTREQLLSANANVAINVARAVSVCCPDALLAFITNPVNTIVPLAAEILKEEDAYDPKRLFGITTLDVVRAKTFIGESVGVNPLEVSVPVVGGHAGETILTLVSQSQPKFDGCEKEREELVRRVQQAGTEVVKAKVGKGSATLSMAYAGAHFVNALLRGLNNEQNVIECAYVQSDVSEAEFFATPVLLGPKGIQKNLGLPELDEHEEDAVELLVPKLLKDIKAGVQLVK